MADWMVGSLVNLTQYLKVPYIVFLKTAESINQSINLTKASTPLIGFESLSME